ncbi:MAG: transcription elongation factor GreA [Anaerolineales bacterium]|jgi:transcription elongation factor GreA|nr:transcription elongation factor GreA [Anaerolineales bacterium]
MEGLNMPEEHFLTADGAERLKNELHHLVTVEREALAKRLRAAIQEGDLSENADYSKAKEDQGFLEGRIQELEYLLKYAIIVEASATGYDQVEVGARVTVKEDGYEPETFSLVGAKETDPSQGKISNESPVGKALLGKKVGDVVSVETPVGALVYKIVKIE